MYPWAIALRPTQTNRVILFFRECLRVIRFESKRMFWSQASLLVMTLGLLGLTVNYCGGSSLLGFVMGCAALGMVGVTAVTHQERKNAMQAVFERTRSLLEKSERESVEMEEKAGRGGSKRV